MEESQNVDFPQTPSIDDLLSAIASRQVKQLVVAVETLDGQILTYAEIVDKAGASREFMAAELMALPEMYELASQDT